jgi:hypothetical protein
LVPWGLFIAATSTLTSVEPGLLNANVLAYAINADAAQHVAARTLREAARPIFTKPLYGPKMRTSKRSLGFNIFLRNLEGNKVPQ